MSRVPLSLYIDRLQLEGLPISNPGLLAPLIEQELRALFSQQPLPTPTVLRGVPSIVLSAGETAGSISRKIAAAIHQSVLQHVPPTSGTQQPAATASRTEGPS
jgi:hypothetical protein